MLRVKKRALALCLCFISLCQPLTAGAAVDVDIAPFTVTFRTADYTETRSTPAGEITQDIPQAESHDGLRFVAWRDDSGAIAFPETQEIYSDVTFTAAFAPELRSEHVSCISGYDDGSFRPDAPLTRAEACAILLKLLPEDFQPAMFPDPAASSGDSAGNPFEAEASDSLMPCGNAQSETSDSGSFSTEAEPEQDESSSEPWYAGAVSVMSRIGLLHTDENGALRPTEPITRAEFISMLAGFFPIYPARAEFSDLSPEHPAYAEIAFAADLGWAGGYDDGSFRPDAPLTRAESVTVLCRALGRNGDKAATDYHIRRFTDLPPSHWAFLAVMESAVPHTPELDENGNETWTEYPELRIEPGFHYDGGDLLYVSPETGWYVSDTSVNGFRFDTDGRYTSGSAELDGYVKYALSQTTLKDMTREEMLHAAYNYTRDSFTYLRRNYYETGDTGWEMGNALVMFQTRCGNCYSYAAVFYYLARQLGYQATAVSGKVGTNRSPHGWVEIDFDGVPNIFDPELEMSYRLKDVYYYDFYMMPYSRTPWPYEALGPVSAA